MCVVGYNHLDGKKQVERGSRTQERVGNEWNKILDEVGGGVGLGILQDPYLWLGGATEFNRAELESQIHL